MPEIPGHASTIGLGSLVHSKNGHINKIQPAQSQLNEDPKNPKRTVGIAFLHDLGFVKGLNITVLNDVCRPVFYIFAHPTQVFTEDADAKQLNTT